MINGSAKSNGCTFTALNEIAKTLEQQGIESQIINIGTQPIRDCIGCEKCKDNRCVFNDDIVNKILEQAQQADGLIFGTPVYYAHPSGRVLSLLDRLFYSGKKCFEHKPGAAIASARRAGTTASIDVLNKYFTISQMPVVSSTYWNMVHGSKPEDVLQDLEGMQTMRNIALNMAWLLKCIDLGKKNKIDIPSASMTERTNFIR